MGLGKLYVNLLLGRASRSVRACGRATSAGHPTTHGLTRHKHHFVNLPVFQNSVNREEREFSAIVALSSTYFGVSTHYFFEIFRILVSIDAPRVPFEYPRTQPKRVLRCAQTGNSTPQLEDRKEHPAECRHAGFTRSASGEAVRIVGTHLCLFS